MQEKFTVTIIQDHDQQAEVKNNFCELEGEWQDVYVNFSGYFGHHGPHKFAQGPVLYEALELVLDALKHENPLGWEETIEQAEDALRLARGE